MTADARNVTRTGRARQANGPVLVQASLFLLFALVVAASFLPDARLWGINHLAFYPLRLRIIVLALVGVCFIPRVASYVHSFLISIPEELQQLPKKSSTLLIVAIALISIAIFWSFRSSTNLLGDGQLIERSFTAADKTNIKVIMRSPGAIVREEHIAPGVTLLYFGAAKMATALGRSSGVGIRFINCILGGLLVLTMLMVTRDAPGPPGLRALLLYIGVMGCTLELFFGYMETYTPLVFFLALYVIAGLRVIVNRGSVAWPVILFLAGAYSHLQGVLFFASLVFLVVWRMAQGRKNSARVEKVAVPVLIVLIVATAALAWRYTTLHSFFLPLRSTDTSYGVFSMVHLGDIANELLMMLPLLPVVIVTGLVVPRKATPAANNASLFASPAQWRFTALILAPCSIYLLFFKPELGMARDWDLFSMMAVGLVPLAMLLANRYFQANNFDEGVVARLSTPAVILTIALAFAWYGINASPMRTADRFERILSYDQSFAEYAYENLAVFYESHDNMERAVEIMERACELSHNPRHYVRLALYYEQTGRLNDSIDLMFKVLKDHPDYEKARFKLVGALDQTDRLDDLIEVARAGTVLHPDKAIYFFYLGNGLIMKGEIDEGLMWLLKCRTLNPPAAALDHIEKMMKKYGRE